MVIPHEFAEKDVGHVVRETRCEPDVGPFFGDNVDRDPLCGEGAGEELGRGVQEVDYGGGVEDGVAANGDGGGRLDLQGCVVHETELEGGVGEGAVFSDEMVHCLLSDWEGWGRDF